MGISTKPATFQTSDGEEFEDQQKAERHQSLLNARQAVSAAEKAYGELLAATQKTADGATFRFGYHSYWVVQTNHGEPYLQEFPVNSSIRTSFNDGVLHLDRGFNSGGSVSIAELYFRKHNAIKALIAKLEEFKKGVTERIEALTATAQLPSD